MSSSERKTKIINHLINSGYVSVKELSHALSVSEVTIRSDLRTLEEQNKLKRTFGGALPFVLEKPDAVPEADVRASFYMDKLHVEKQAIAKLAVGMIKTNEVLFLDDSNTSYFLAMELAQKDREVVVVTNSLDILYVLSSCQAVHSILTGGEYYKQFNSVFGIITEQTIVNIRASKAFISPRALDREQGVLMVSSLSTNIRRKMLDFSAKHIIIADHSKFQNSGVIQLAGWYEIHTVITDTIPPEPFLEQFDKFGIKYLIP